MVNYEDFLKWAELRERNAFIGFTKSDILEETFNERLGVDRVYASYLPYLTYRRYLYSDVMHNFIMISNIGDTDALKSLYVKYGIEKESNMMLSSASDSGTAGGMFIPGRLNDADLGMLNYYQTPYGKVVESINQQLFNIVI